MPCSVSGQTCSNGVCGCPAGDTICAGACVDTTTDPNNCGTCGEACGVFAGNGLQILCTMSACCPAPPSGVLRPEYVCNGVCTDPDDNNNCGGCGVVCPAAHPYCDWDPFVQCCDSTFENCVKTP